MASIIDDGYFHIYTINQLKRILPFMDKHLERAAAKMVELIANHDLLLIDEESITNLHETSIAITEAVQLLDGEQFEVTKLQDADEKFNNLQAAIENVQLIMAEKLHQLPVEYIVDLEFIMFQLHIMCAKLEYASMMSMYILAMHNRYVS